MKKILAVVTVFAIVLLMFSTVVLIVATQTDEWSVPQQLTFDPAVDDDASIMQDSSGKIWLVWARGMPGMPEDLMFKTSSDGGVSWSDPEILISDIQICMQTSMLQDSTGRIWVAWASGQYSPSIDFDIFYITSDDGGLSWSLPQPLMDDTGDSNVPSLIEVSGEVWIVWRRSHDVWYKKTDDGGATWSDPIQLNPHTLQSFTTGAMVDSTGKVWIAWTRDRDVHYKTSMDNGASWSPDQQLTFHPNVETASSLVEDVCGKIYIFYSIYDAARNPDDIWYKTTVDGGNTWSDAQELTSDAYGNYDPSAASVNNEIWVAWSRNIDTHDVDIWLSKLVPETIPATVDIDPDTLNLESNGQWVTAYITLPEGCDVEDIVLETVYVDGTPAEWSEIQNGVYMVKFERATVQSSLTNEPDYESAPKFYELTLTVTGEFLDGTPFEGTDTIRVLSK